MDEEIHEMEELAELAELEEMEGHTFLFEEGKWAAEGEYWDQRGVPIPTTGATRIFHHESVWVVESRLAFIGEESVEFTNAYHANPFQDGQLSTPWVSTNPALGKLFGNYAVVGDSIFSVFESEDGNYKGSVCMLQIDEATYEERGVLFEGDMLISAWALTLTREA